MQNSIPMNPPLRRIDRVSPLVWLAVLIPVLRAVAQPSAELEIQTYAGLTITGEVGKVYSIEYVTDLNDPAESDWRCLEFLQLPASPYLWADKSAPATGKRFYRTVAMEAPTNMVFIPPGTFRMGSPSNEDDHGSDEGPQTEVIISMGYWIGKYEVTQGDYLEVMGHNPSWYNGMPLEGGPDYGINLKRPVESVSWFDTVEYCAKRTEKERQVGGIPTSCLYRLPTEAEWEYACRAWTSTRFSHGDDPGYTNLTAYAWYFENNDSQMHSVGEKLPNPWGLYDMHGNAFEWCHDWYGAYPGGIVLDPQGPEAGAYGAYRVARGGYWYTSWGVILGFCRSAYRTAYDPETRAADIGFSTDIGFRVVLATSPPQAEVVATPEQTDCGVGSPTPHP